MLLLKKKYQKPNVPTWDWIIILVSYYVLLVLYYLLLIEKTTGYNFLRLLSQPVPAGYSSVSEKFMPHASFLVGQRVMRPGSDLSTESGYQALRLATELVPATLALLGTDTVSPFWAVLFYFILILFGIAQQVRKHSSDKKQYQRIFLWSCEKTT